MRHQNGSFTDHAGEETQPLPNLGALAFQLFLNKHGLSILDVALAARVRLVTVWKITRGQPISVAQAELVRGALAQLTRVSYRGQIIVHREMPNP